MSLILTDPYSFSKDSNVVAVYNSLDLYDGAVTWHLTSPWGGAEVDEATNIPCAAPLSPNILALNAGAGGWQTPFWHFWINPPSTPSDAWFYTNIAPTSDDDWVEVIIDDKYRLNASDKDWGLIAKISSSLIQDPSELKIANELCSYLGEKLRTNDQSVQLKMILRNIGKDESWHVKLV